MLLKELTQINGVSGNECEVKDFIKNVIKEYADDIRIDTMGNLIAYKKGKSGKYKVMLSAHMDEVGMMVTGYGENGNLKFRTVGGIDERILPGKEGIGGKNRIPGVIGFKPLHLQEKEERNSEIKKKSLYIDIGADKKEEAEELAPLGEYISFQSDFVEFGEDCIKAKALDDRVGCAVIIEALKDTYEFDLYACFTVQEEIGLRGSETAAYHVNPHIALVIEGTTCSDVPGVKKQDYSTVMGDGPALTIMDRTSYADKELVKYIYGLAVNNDIKVQYKKTTTGGNDAGKIQLIRGGVKTAAISVPCRYIHSPASVMSKTDFTACEKLVKTVLGDLNNEDNIKRIIGGK
jgi:endoglucanase